MESVVFNLFVRAVFLTTGLVISALLAGCAGNPSGAGYSSVASNQGCKDLDRRMRSLVAKGKQNTAAYDNLLNSYLSRGCYR